MAEKKENYAGKGRHFRKQTYNTFRIRQNGSSSVRKYYFGYVLFFQQLACLYGLPAYFAPTSRLQLDIQYKFGGRTSLHVVVTQLAKAFLTNQLFKVGNGT